MMMHALTEALMCRDSGAGTDFAPVNPGYCHIHILHSQPIYTAYVYSHPEPLEKHGQSAAELVVLTQPYAWDRGRLYNMPI